ncbi:hypothetical protein DW962_14295 [Blautia sp. AM46-5]|uniref:Uncharacterized protein n=1 Tax=Blautia faecicola TaxID=2509240 RepID=A0A4Q1RLC1_9FIRM|nr:hypothetical protein DW962_14295 [Blautia sp. AM46-5]RHS55274.1 hypothetical protein DW961_14650 [Blautia sp. AM46-3MH]RXS76634.1 hypothetical protein ETP43_02675 [Blautia faecicola]
MHRWSPEICRCHCHTGA